MNQLYAGFSRVNVTPMLGIGMAGYFKPRYAEGVLDELEINAVALACGEDKVLLMSIDHCGIVKEVLNPMREHISQATGLPLEAIRQQIASAVDIIVHLSRLRDKSRKTMEITEVLGYENGQIILNPLYVFVEDEKSTLTKVSGKLTRTENEMKNTHKLILSGIKTVI